MAPTSQFSAYRNMIVRLIYTKDQAPRPEGLLI